MSEEPESIRTSLSSEQRVANLDLAIDPGFVNYRRIQALLGPEGMTYVDRDIASLPALPGGLQRTRIDHIYMRYLLTFCRAVRVPSLGELLAAGKGRICCAVIEVGPCPEVYDAERVSSPIVLAGDYDLSAQLDYSTEHLHSSTTTMELFQGGPVAVVAELAHADSSRLIFHPLLMGAPWLEDGAEQAPFEGPEWHSFDYFEVFTEDIDEFAGVRETPPISDFRVMADISESAFKSCLGSILGDSVQADWAGERSDHYTAHVHLHGRRATAAFLLKGPARFEPMRLDNLGKRNDQIYRLAAEPAQLLVVQHCHDIGSAVRATLRAFAVQPANPRRYSLIDGRDSLQLLSAYGLVERALDLSREAGHGKG